VTNARIAALHGLSVGPLPARPCPCHSAKPRARHERQLIGRNSGGLPSAARRRRCAPTPISPSLRLRYTSSAHRPQTEADSRTFCFFFPHYLKIICFANRMKQVVIENQVINPPIIEPEPYFRFSDEEITNEIVEFHREKAHFIPIRTTFRTTISKSPR